MYKVCFVDDEPMIPRVMHTLVDWPAMGFTIAGIATDGLEALELYEKERPDLLFLDIKMPLMDGIACARRIRARDKRIRLILLTAFDSFDFARSAIELGINGYLLKPVNREAVNELVARMAAELDTEGEKAEQQAQEGRRRALRKELRYLHDTEESRRDPAWLRESHLFAAPYGLVDLYTNAGEDAMAENFAAFLEGLDVKVWAEYQAKPGRFFLLTTPLLPKIQKAMQSFLAYLPKERHCAGYVLPDLSRLTGEALAQGLAANAAHSFYHYANGVQDFMHIPPCVQRPLSRREMEAPLHKAVAEQDLAQVQALLDEACRIAEKQPCSPHQLKTFCYDLCVQVRMALLQFAPATPQPEEWEPGIEYFLGASHVQMLCQRTIAAVDHFLSKARASKNHTAVIQANAFAAQHFSDPALSLESAAQHVGLSKNYFIKLYKQEMGGGFWEYVTTLRINRAKELLRQTNLTTAEICERIGYDNVYYFSRKFKFVVGMSPREYRAGA